MKHAGKKKTLCVCYVLAIVCLQISTNYIHICQRTGMISTSLVPHYISQHIAISCVIVIARECVLYAEYSTRGGVESLSHKRYHKEQRCRLPVLYVKIQHWRCAFDAPTQNTISGIIYIHLP